MFDTESIALKMVHEMWSSSDRDHACPYLRHDGYGCYCTSPRVSLSGDRYTPCDHFSLQLWCLTEDHYTKCCLFPPGDVP
jgi:hypothetical protein